MRSVGAGGSPLGSGVRAIPRAPCAISRWHSDFQLAPATVRASQLFEKRYRRTIKARVCVPVAKHGSGAAIFSRSTTPGPQLRVKHDSRAGGGGYMPSPLMAPPPWVLISPTGVPHAAMDANDLSTLHVRSDEINEFALVELKKLVGLKVHTKDAKALPLHRMHWQLRSRVPCVRCEETGEHVFIVGGEASYFKNLTHLHHPSMATFDWERFTTFLNKGGWIWTTASGGRKVMIDFYSPKNSPHKWRLVVPPTDVLLARFPAPEVCVGSLNRLASASHARTEPSLGEPCILLTQAFGCGRVRSLLSFGRSMQSCLTSPSRTSSADGRQRNRRAAPQHTAAMVAACTIWACLTTRSTAARPAAARSVAARLVARSAPGGTPTTPPATPPMMLPTNFPEIGTSQSRRPISVSGCLGGHGWP